MNSLEVKQKSCSQCKQVKALDAFYRNRNTKDGYAYDCKKCRDSRPRKPHWKTEKGRTAGRERYLRRCSTPEGKAILFERSKRYKQSAKGKLTAWARHLLKNYGISLSTYELMLQAQDGVCAICKAPPQANRRMHVDHDHITNTIRGILCGKCNQALGMLNEDPTLFDRAKLYLLLHQNKA